MMGYKHVTVPPLPTDMLAAENPLRAAILAWIAATGSTVPPQDLAAQLARADAMPADMQRDIALLILSTIDATAMQKEALAKVPLPTLAFLYAHPEIAQDLAAGKVTPETRMAVAAASLVDMPKSIEATLLLLEAVEATRGTFEKHDAEQALAKLNSAQLDPTTQKMLSLILAADPHMSDAGKVRMAAQLVSMGAGIPLPADPAPASFNVALAQLLAATHQAPSQADIIAAQTRANALPADLQTAIAGLISAEAGAVHAASPEGLTPTSQPQALATVLLATADAMPTLEKYDLYWGAAPDALRVGEWTPGARAGWAAYHAALFVRTDGDLVNVARASAILTGHELPAVPTIPQMSFVDAYVAMSTLAGYTVNDSVKAQVQSAGDALDPSVRDAATIMMNGAYESARLQNVAFANLSRADKAFLLQKTIGMDELYAKGDITSDELATLTHAAVLAKRVDAQSLAQAGIVAALATQQAKDVLSRAGSVSTQSAGASIVPTGVLSFLRNLLPFGSAEAQANLCPGFSRVVDTCGSDTILDLHYPFFGSPAELESQFTNSNFACNEAQCDIYVGEANDQLLVITGSAGSVHSPEQAIRFVCPSAVNSTTGQFQPVFDDSCHQVTVARYGAPTISLDLGGADTYEAPVAMVAVNASLPVSLHLDMGGNDAYADPSSLYDAFSPLELALGSKNGHPTEASAPMGGVAILLDADGANTYIASRMSQGYARFGFALLANTGQQSDIFQASGLSQGAASDTFTLGSGILLDVGGDDQYTTTTGQGFGLGGVLLDLGGHDSYANERDPMGLPVVHLDIIPGGNLTSTTQRGDDRIWMDGPGSISVGLGVDTELVVTNGDTDRDLFPDFVEFLAGTDPYNAHDNPTTHPTARADALVSDSDKDGYPDYIERALSTDPNDPASYPAGLPAGPGIVIPAAVYQLVSDEFGGQPPVDQEVNPTDTVATTAGTNGTARSSDKIVDLRLPIQNAGTIDYACTGEFYQNETSPDAVPFFVTPGERILDATLPIAISGGGPIHPFSSLTPLGATDNSTNSHVTNKDGSPIQRCAYVSYQNSQPGQGNGTVPFRNTDQPTGDSDLPHSAYTFSVPTGILAIGDVVDTKYANDYFVAIDLGGNDRFEGSPGGALPVVTQSTPSADGKTDQDLNNSFLAPSLVVNIDLHDQLNAVLDVSGPRDTYYNTTRDFSEGSFFGALVDNAGNDLYWARDASQGSLGGVLLDLDGTDQYLAGNLSQGAGLAGNAGNAVSDLPDDGRIPSDSFGRAGSQATGPIHHVLSGLLLDLGSHSGLQTFTAGSYSQGFARGFHADTSKTDSSPEAEGLLVSITGPDQYKATVGSRDSQGVGAIEGAGVLLDREGNDRYLGLGLVTQGATIPSGIDTGENVSSRSNAPRPAIGALIDLSGSDVYKTDLGVFSARRQQNTTITRDQSATNNDGTRLYADTGIGIDTELQLDPSDPAGSASAFVAGIGGTGSKSLNDTGFVVDLPTARLAIGDDSDTTFTRDYAFAVDTGGHNTWIDNAGGLVDDAIARSDSQRLSTAQQYPSALQLFPVTLALDAANTSSNYISTRGLAQGAGFFSIGILADLGGQDSLKTVDQPIAGLKSTWVDAAPTIDATVGDDWAGVPAQYVTLVAQNDSRLASNWTLHMANDNHTLYMALEGTTTSADDTQRVGDSLNISLDMGHRAQEWDSAANRTGIDQVRFSYSGAATAADPVKCEAHDWGYNRSPARFEQDDPDASVPMHFEGACRFTDDGRVIYEFRKDLVNSELRDARKPNLDLDYCWDDSAGFGYRTNESRNTCSFPATELGVTLSFNDRGAGFVGAGQLPATFSWPAGSQDYDGGYNGIKNGNLSDEMTHWADAGLADGADKPGVDPRATNPSGITQGAGVAGIGVLALLGTGDSDKTLVASDHAQGYGGFGGMGILLSASGSDSYTAGHHVQGAAETSAAAIFLDAQGNDVYTSTGHSLGDVSNSSSAYFFDLGGDDRYDNYPALSTATVNQLHDVRHDTTSENPPVGNNQIWVQNQTGFGADFVVASTITDALAGNVAQNLYGASRTSVQVTQFKGVGEEGTFANGCSLVPVDTQAADAPALPRFVAHDKVCLIATVDSGNESAEGCTPPTGVSASNTNNLCAPTSENRSIYPTMAALAANLSGASGGAIDEQTLADASRTVDARAVDFMLDRQRIASAYEVSARPSRAVTVFSTPVDLGNFSDGVKHLTAVTTFSAELDGRGVIVFTGESNSTKQLQDSVDSRTLIVNNAPRPAFSLQPEYQGIANATFSPFAYGAAQQLYINWTTSPDADEDTLAESNGYESPAFNTSMPCTGTPSADEVQLCRVYPFYLVPQTTGPLTTEPGPNTAQLPSNLQVEQVDANPFNSETTVLSSPLRIMKNGSFHLALPGRTSLSFVNNLNTFVNIEVRDPAGLPVHDANGNAWLLGHGLWSAAASLNTSFVTAPVSSQLKTVSNTVNGDIATVNGVLAGASSGNVVWNVVLNTTVAELNSQSPTADLINGNLGSGNVRPCASIEPNASSGVPQWLAWYAVQVVDRRDVFVPSNSPFTTNPQVPAGERHWPLTDVPLVDPHPVPPSPVPDPYEDERVCHHITNDVNRTGQQFGAVQGTTLPTIPSAGNPVGDGLSTNTSANDSITDFWFDVNSSLPPQAVHVGSTVNTDHNLCSPDAFNKNGVFVDPTKCIVDDGQTIVIPAGFKIHLNFGLTSGNASAVAPGKNTINPELEDLAKQIQDQNNAAYAAECQTLGQNPCPAIHPLFYKDEPPHVPGVFPSGVPVVNALNLSSTVNTELLSLRATGTNVDSLISSESSLPASVFFYQTAISDDKTSPPSNLTNQARFEIRSPQQPTTGVSVTLDDPFTNQVVRELRGTSPTDGDRAGSPTRDGAVIEKDWSVIHWTAKDNGTRWTQHSIAYSDADLEGLYVVNITAADHANNVASHTDSVLIDKTAPQTWVTTPNFVGTPLLHSGSIPLTWAASDVGGSQTSPLPGSGIDHVYVYHRSDPNGDIGDMSTWDGPLVFPAGATSELQDATQSNTHLFLTIGVDRAGNVEGTHNDANLSTALASAFAAKIAQGTNRTDGRLGYTTITIDQGLPRYSSTAIVGGRVASYQGTDFTFVRAGEPVSFQICARDNETDIGVVNVSLDHIDPSTQALFGRAFAATRDGTCDNGAARYRFDGWAALDSDQKLYPEGVWSVVFDVYDDAANHIRVPAGNVILDHNSPLVNVQPAILPSGQTAVKPGDLVKIRFITQDAFGVDDGAIRVDASAFNTTGKALATRPVRVDGVVYQEAAFIVDRQDLQNANYNVTVKVPDLAQNFTIKNVTIAVNTRTFEFLPGSLSVTDITHNTAILRWRTSEATSSMAKYGATAVTLNGRTPIDTNATTEHAVKITGLSPSTHYVLKAVSISTGGFTKESDPIEIDTSTALYLSPISPVSGAKVSGLVPIQFKGGLLDSSDFVTFTLEVRDSPTKPWTFITTATRQGDTHELSWNSTRFLDGSSYELRLTASAGKDTASVEIKPIVSDNTPPAVTIISPLLATNDTTPTLLAEASDDLSGLATAPAKLSIDGVAVPGQLGVDKLPDGRVRISYEIQTPLAPGMRTFELDVADAAGNVAHPTWKVAIDGDPPVVAVNPTRFSPGTTEAKLGGTVTLNLTVTDLSGVSLVSANVSSLSDLDHELRLVKIVGTDEWQGTFPVTAGDDAATKIVKVHAVDLAGNARDINVPIPVDNVPPTVGATSVAEIGYTHVTIDVPADEPILVTGVASAPQSPTVTVSMTNATANAALVFTGLLPSRTYSYHLDVTDGAGNAVPIVGSVRTLNDTKAPSSVGPLSVVDLMNGTLRFTWNHATDDVAVAFYRVYRSDDGVTFHVLAETPETTYDDAGLPYEKPYVYKVAAVDYGANEGPTDGTLRASATAVPHLSTGVVSPTVGSVNTNFHYSIVYTSPGGRAPAYVHIILDGVTQNMTLVSGDAKSGLVYKFETKLAPHKRDAPHTYAFETSDGRYTARFPEDGTTLRGPLVSGDALSGAASAGGLASFAAKVPLGGAAGLGLAVVMAVGVAALLGRKKKEGSK